MTIDERLNEFKGEEGRNQGRIDTIMTKISQEPRVLRPKTSKKILMWAASLILCFGMLVPINGQSFAGGIIEWFKETIIESEYGFLAASDEHVSGVMPDFTLKTYNDMGELSTVMGDMSFEVPQLPENMVFHSAEVYEYDREEGISVLYRLQFTTEEGQIGSESQDPQLFIQVSVNDYKIELMEYGGAKGEVEIKFGTKVVAEGLQSTKVDFMDQKALFTKYDKVYSLAAQPITLELQADLYRQISCSVSYMNMGQEELWAPALEILEAVCGQYGE